MTTARKPAGAAPDNLMLIVGQLLEATKAASDGLKSMSQEVQSNAKAIIAASKTLEQVEDTLEELDEIIRDTTNASNLVSITQKHGADLVTLHAAVTDLKGVVETLKVQVGTLGTTQVAATTTKNTLAWIAAGLAWAVTTGIALYAALNGK
jgi:methyl-accepting chemotaxis protein